MRVTSFNITITSEQPDRLMEFYRDLLGFEQDEVSGGLRIGVGEAYIYIDGHSETKGRAKEPHRVLINFFVDDLAAEQAALEAQGVEFTRTAGREFWGGVISTFLDPDGNYLQLIEFKPEAA
jgi:predicted enzyme related to lactoylglutathione lyase